MNNFGKWTAFLMLLIACLAAFGDKFRELWPDFKEQFPDEPDAQPETDYNQAPVTKLSNPIADMSFNQGIQAFEQHPTQVIDEDETESAREDEQ